jgi:hypothetical protein
MGCRLAHHEISVISPNAEGERSGRPLQRDHLVNITGNMRCYGRRDVGIEGRISRLRRGIILGFCGILLVEACSFRLGWYEPVGSSDGFGRLVVEENFRV